MTDEQFQAMLDVHLVAPFRILRAAAEPIRVMAKREALEGREVFRKVVNVSSIAGLYGNAGQAAYGSAKASLVGLTRTLCKEWGRYKVNVNCVAFGLINTRLTQPIEAAQATIDVAGRDIKVGMQPSLLETMGRMIPLGRGGTPQEAAGGGVHVLQPGLQLRQRAGAGVRRRPADLMQPGMPYRSPWMTEELDAFRDPFRRFLAAELAPVRGGLATQPDGGPHRLDGDGPDGRLAASIPEGVWRVGRHLRARCRRAGGSGAYRARDR